MKASDAILLLDDVTTDGPLPPPPTRDQICRVQLTFQGLTVETQAHGVLPWFEAALICLDLPADRQAAYATKHGAGDTHCILQYSKGGFLYNEPGQPYDNFPVPDFTQDRPRFTALVREVITAGFHPLIFMDGDGEQNYAWAYDELPRLVAALGELTRYVIIGPGWDGVFYGWTPDHITAWGALFRSVCPDGYLFIEHQPGRIPCGEGPSDWTPTGRMGTYDVLLSEFNNWAPGEPAGDGVWQIGGRLLGPAYRRPPDQPAGDDPRPPWYLATGSARGPFYPIAFEYFEYEWVRTRVSLARIQQLRNYFTAAGWTWVS
jgi:hypothetical protein